MYIYPQNSFINEQITCNPSSRARITRGKGYITCRAPTTYRYRILIHMIHITKKASSPYGCVLHHTPKHIFDWHRTLREEATATINSHRVKGAIGTLSDFLKECVDLCALLNNRS